MIIFSFNIRKQKILLQLNSTYKTSFTRKLELNYKKTGKLDEKMKSTNVSAGLNVNGSSNLKIESPIYDAIEYFTEKTNTAETGAKPFHSDHGQMRNSSSESNSQILHIHNTNSKHKEKKDGKRIQFSDVERQT